jgi:NAD(P)-dependent dehydrogenase (short-subunit alcohol dehydrogenase family)
LQQLENKVALVTGGGRGLGRAICSTLACSGVRVLVADVRDDLACETAELIGSEFGDRAATVHLDVSSDNDAKTAIEDAVSRYGRLDILVNNAGTDTTKAVEDLSVEEWQRVIEVNLTGPFIMARQALAVMAPRGEGSIVNIVSTASKRAWANAAAYHASKWGLLGLSHALHVEGRSRGIKVTAVVAGGMRTPFLLDRFPDLDPGLLQDPATVAETVRFVLCQPLESVIPEVMVLPMRETSWP